jgi:integrase/recombinase XerC
MEGVMERYPEPKRNRHGKWVVDYRFMGVRRRAQFDGYDAAKQHSDFTWSCVKEGRDPKLELLVKQEKAKSQAVTLSMYWLKFLDRHGKKVSTNTRASYECSWKHIGESTEMIGCPMSLLQPYTIDAYVYRRQQQGASASSICTEINLIRAMLSQALKDGLLETNPLKGKMDMPKKDNKREISLSRDEQTTLVNAIGNKLHRDMVMFGIYTGLRKDEIFSLRCEDVQVLPKDIQCRVFSRVTIRRKGGKHQTVVVSPHATEILVRNIGDREEGPMFVSRFGKRLDGHTKLTGFEAAVEALGLTAIQAGQKVPMCFHDLRRVYAANIRSEGADALELQNGMGHEDFSTTQHHYLSQGDCRGIAERQTRIG